MAKKRKATLDSVLKKAGWAPSLPAALLGSDGALLDCNKRMRILLGLAAGQELPLAPKRLESAWPFFNEEDSKPALWYKLARFHPTESWSVAVENGLKTFRLHLVPVDSRQRLFVAELVRSGDLLGDEASRQALFRSLSHEIRTSVLALKGYLSMLEAEGAAPTILPRMSASVERLEKVVERLGDFRAALARGKAGSEDEAA